MAKLSPRQYGMLLLIAGDTEGAVRENAKRARRGKFKRMPVGRLAARDRTLTALEARGLVEVTEHGPGVVWTLTAAGKEALDAERA